MPIDPQLLKQLVDTFKTELQEQCQVITNGLLTLEKDPAAQNDPAVITAIFRSAHNIKGASRSLGIIEVGDIAHHIESIFAEIQKKSIAITPKLIDVCLAGVDKMQIAMQSYLDKAPLPFDLESTLKDMEQACKQKNTSNQKLPESKAEPEKANKKQITAEVLAQDSMRVSIDNIDQISAIMEELQINKIAFDDYYEKLAWINTKMKYFSETWKQIATVIKNNGNTQDSLQKLFHTGNDVFSEISHATHLLNNGMKGQIGTLSTLFNSLQDEIRTLRLVPISNLLCTMPRYVRDLGRDLDKKVELTISGDTVRIDRMVLDHLKDPIIHILRNCVDHGIEATNVRVENNKSEIGKIAIDITEYGGKINIIIRDDGGGIDPQKIAMAALKKGIITKDEFEVMSDQQKINLIFKPGLSTAAMITDLSGRGVGLDVVKNNLNNVNGLITVSSEIGKGTSFTLSLPLTLSSERGLMVKVNENCFVIPTNNISRIVRVQMEEILEVEGIQAIKMDTETIPLYSLASMLGMNQREISAGQQLSIVIIHKDDKTLGVLVEEIFGEKEIVIKPFQSLFHKVPFAAGGTISGNNQVIIVLDAINLLDTAYHSASHEQINFEKASAETVEIPHILVVDDSITTRALEKNILESKNYQVTVAVNGKEAWELLLKNKYSLVITDINMPIMDGLALTQHVKQHDKLKHLPVIIVTSLGSDAEKKRGIEVGADAYIVKNEFESGALLQVVEQLV